MATMTSALRQIKDDLPTSLNRSTIERACRERGHRWRNRRLGPVQTIQLFLLQIVHGNIACSALRHLSALATGASAYCQARARLPVAVLQRLAETITAGVVGSLDAGYLWHGHRLVHIDGTSFSMKDTPALQAWFGQPGAQRAGCGFPVAHLGAVVHAASGLVLDLIASPLRTHDMATAAGLHATLGEGDVLVGDRGFCSYAHLALIALDGLHAVLRAHQRQIICFGPRRHAKAKRQAKGGPTSIFVRRLGRKDQLVQWVKPKTVPAWMTDQQYAALPARLTVRELAYTVRIRGRRTRHVTLVTTLTDPARYPREALADVYQQRWQIEVNFRHLKETLGMDVLRCQSVDGVMKELWMFMLVYNLVRAVMLAAARRQDVDPDRISFVDTLRWLRYRRTNTPLVNLIVNPIRDGRIEPRVRKRRPKPYPRMTRPRHQLRKELTNQTLKP